MSRQAIPCERGAVSKSFLKVFRGLQSNMYLPPELVSLIKSFLPKPPMPYVQIPLYYAYDYMSVQDWNDVDEVRSCDY